MCAWCAVSKAELAALFKADVVQQFKRTVYVRGHNLTDYSRWLDAQEAYEVVYQAECEPWVISHRDVLPW